MNYPLNSKFSPSISSKQSPFFNYLSIVTFISFFCSTSIHFFNFPFLSLMLQSVSFPRKNTKLLQKYSMEKVFCWISSLIISIVYLYKYILSSISSFEELLFLIYSDYFTIISVYYYLGF